MAGYDVRDYGAAGDGLANDAAAIQAAIDACHRAGGGTVLLPAGRVFRSGSIELRSRVALEIERGAVLQASEDPADYTHRRASATPGFGPDAPPPGEDIMLITADGAQDVAILGAGTIDGGGRFFVAEDRGTIYAMREARPLTVYLVGCRRVTVRDVLLRDAAAWTLRLTGCRSVLVSGVRIENDLKVPNSDGIDLDCVRDARISDCHISTGDDAISIKGRDESVRFGDTENVTVSGCTLVSTSSAFAIGADCATSVRNVVVDSCVVDASNRGLSVNLGQQGDVSDVLFSNIVVRTRLFDEPWWGHGEPIYVAVNRWTGAVGSIRNVRFSNITARSENSVVVRGGPGEISGVVFDGVSVALSAPARWPGGRIDVRPAAEEFVKGVTAGFHLERATDVVLRGCRVRWEGEPAADFGPALLVSDVQGLSVTDFDGVAAHPERDEARVYANSPRTSTGPV
ncbi:glycoside hydrolase family 28 protein [Streptomyces sp. CA-111067]|uniref:glycoside hydrolase family 28 protein n=1 Tax=Streptomyces sp. CA-111067 TaxID=3240046 RepID=UPI003D97565F